MFRHLFASKSTSKKTSNRISEQFIVLESMSELKALNKRIRIKGQFTHLQSFIYEVIGNVLKTTTGQVQWLKGIPTDNAASSLASNPERS